MSPHVMKKLAKPMLFAAAIIWGTSFFVMKNALDVIPVFYLLAIRFTAGAVLLAAVCWKKWAGFTRDYLWRGAVIGAFLFLAYSVQTFGLDRTTPSKNAFLTAVYCVIVPFLYWAAARRRPDRYNILAALLCVTGVGLVSLDGDLSVNAGDVLTLICAFFYAAHIVAVAKVSPEKDIYLLTVFQFAFAALYAWAGGALFENFPAQAFLDPAVCLPVRYGHHCGPALPKRGAGVVGPGLRVGDPLPGIGVRRHQLGPLLRGSGHSPHGGGLCLHLCGGGVL